MAQSNGGSPTEPTGSKASDATSSGMMSKDKMAKEKMMKSGTSGEGPMSDDASGKANTPASSGNVSPASPNAGEKQEK